MTTKEEKFCNLYLELGSGSQAYREAYNKPDLKPDQASTKAYELLQKGYISEMIEQLREEAKLSNKIDRDWILQKHKVIIDWYEELKELASKKDLDKEEKSRIYMLKDLIKGSDYRGSIDSVTKMLGLNAPEKIDKEIKIEIVEKKRD